MENLYAESIEGYELLDSGLGQKLEVIAGRRVVRPSPQSIWKPRLDAKEWRKAESINHRTKDGGGRWEHLKPLPSEMNIVWNKLNFNINLSPFGHCGLFFEQEPIWAFLNKKAKELGRPAKGLNLFGYTGAASLSMAQGGAEVFHVDSAKGVLKWGEGNAIKSGLGGKIRWVQEDAMKFVSHSVRKGFTYDLILADPPSWGHGAKKEVWEYNDHIHQLVESIMKILSPKNSTFILVSHTQGVQHEALRNLLAPYAQKADLQAGELGIKHLNDERILPAGIYAKIER